MAIKWGKRDVDVYVNNIRFHTQSIQLRQLNGTTNHN